MTWKTLTFDEGLEMIKDKHVLVLDIRDREEYDSFHLDQALCLPFNQVLARAGDFIKDPEQVVVVYCSRGIRSRYAAFFLCELGFKSVYDMGGIDQEASNK